MPPLIRTAIIALPFVLSACAAGERGLVSPHQPLVGRTFATVPGCPDWSDSLLTASEGQSSNFGCATGRNLAAMIADPADLLHGKKGDGTSSPEIAVRAVKAQRENGTGKDIEKTGTKASQ